MADEFSREAGGHHHHHHHHHHYGARLQALLSPWFHGMTVVPLMLLLCAVGVMPILYDGGTAYWLPMELAFLTLAVGVWMLAGWWCGREANRPHFHPLFWVFGLWFYGDFSSSACRMRAW